MRVVGQTNVPDHLRRRRHGDGVPVERRHRCGDDAGGLRDDTGPRRSSHSLTSSFAISSPTPRVLSFRLPILPTSSCSAGRMPALLDWLRNFTGPSLAAILTTYVALRLTQRPALAAKVAAIKDAPALAVGGKLAAIGIALTVVVLLSVSALDRPLGLPTFCAAVSLTAVVLLIARRSPLPILKDVSWGVLPLVAGLFVVVAGLKSNRRVVGAGAQPARRCRGVAASDVVGHRHRRCCCLQPRQQSAGGSDRVGHRSCCAFAAAGGRRDYGSASISGRKSTHDRLARHHSVADRTAPGGRERYGSSVSELGFIVMPRRSCCRCLPCRRFPP